MLNKLLSTTLLFVALAQVALSSPQFGPGPVNLQCGRPYDPPCRTGQLCCGTDPNNMRCQAAGLFCAAPPPQ
ncbi:hypothetical protein C8R46DRAFT_1229003 [Mycena filopes]|nr:hypothetical protein C8R46DRAFT_1229003 [Mycena filopes]